MLGDRRLELNRGFEKVVFSFVYECVCVQTKDVPGPRTCALEITHTHKSQTEKQPFESVYQENVCIFGVQDLTKLLIKQNYTRPFLSLSRPIDQSGEKERHAEKTFQIVFLHNKSISVRGAKLENISNTFVHFFARENGVKSETGVFFNQISLHKKSSMKISFSLVLI